MPLDNRKCGDLLVQVRDTSNYAPVLYLTSRHNGTVGRYPNVIPYSNRAVQLKSACRYQMTVGIPHNTILCKIYGSAQFNSLTANNGKGIGSTQIADIQYSILENLHIASIAEHTTLPYYQPRIV